MIKKAQGQLDQKMMEVEEERGKFKPYHFTKIVKVIGEDRMLIKLGTSSEATKEALGTFKEDFKPGDIGQGKSWIKEHLQEGLRVYQESWSPWAQNQPGWYLANVIGHMQTRAERCFEYECSQGLKEIVEEKKPLRRDSRVKNYLNDLPLAYRGLVDSSLLLGRDFVVDIYLGRARLCQNFFTMGVKSCSMAFKILGLPATMFPVCKCVSPP